jgi:hypothetical protein
VTTDRAKSIRHQLAALARMSYLRLLPTKAVL